MAGQIFMTLVSGIRTAVAAIQSSSGAADAGKLVGLDANGKLDTSLLPTGVGAETKLLPATENLAAGDLVNVYDATGTSSVRKADGSSYKPAHGFVLASVTSGQNATVYVAGILAGLTGLTGGTEYFLSSTTPGAASATAPSASGAVIQRVGVALSATELAFEPGDAVTIA